MALWKEAWSDEVLAPGLPSICIVLLRIKKSHSPFLAAEWPSRSAAARTRSAGKYLGIRSVPFSLQRRLFCTVSAVYLESRLMVLSRPQSFNHYFAEFLFDINADCPEP